ncbi:hypothetical protein SAMN04489765_3489 [Tsukamurella pulmonis]|uniref:Uncharacterized protein n=1 Tax=Tsukamurella pulmonis TaxID=47312 RepID=A0A1H1GR00_9ACTN|nr:hypothetical protein [Tsukamurella pulmonis]SDR15328.1 hypothetical protein SAMN04489765_3489 [Tsukamurella pulmonis]SUP16867.1 Uncharacterised protein [Tsukamurella pulmonis]
MNNAIINASKQFTAAEGGVFAAVAVRIEASHALPGLSSRLWRLRQEQATYAVDHEPLTRPVCSMRRG